MSSKFIVLITEDDEAHAVLIEEGLKNTGMINEIIRFRDGQEIIDFFSKKEGPVQFKPNEAYVLLLDIKMPKINGFEVLKQIKNDKKLCKLPVVILSTSESPRDIGMCYQLGCSGFIVKSIDYNKFEKRIKNLVKFLSVISIPKLD